MYSLYLIDGTVETNKKLNGRYKMYFLFLLLQMTNRRIKQ